MKYNRNAQRMTAGYAGWTYRRSGKQDVRQEGNVKIYGVPYSEHSSFPELRDCVATLRPLKLIPTVNATNHTAAENIISRFAVSLSSLLADNFHPSGLLSFSLK